MMSREELISVYPNHSHKKESGQVLTDWGPPYPPDDYVFRAIDVSQFTAEYTPVPREYLAPPTIGYPRFIPEFQKLINEGAIEVWFRAVVNKVDSRNIWMVRLKQPTLF